MTVRKPLVPLTRLRLAGRVTAHDTAVASSRHGDERTTPR